MIDQEHQLRMIECRACCSTDLFYAQSSKQLHGEGSYLFTNSLGDRTPNSTALEEAWFFMESSLLFHCSPSVTHDQMCEILPPEYTVGVMN